MIHCCVFLSFEDGCYKNCPVKTYSVEEDMSCVPCDEHCVSCDEQDALPPQVHTVLGKESSLFVTEGKCVTVCPDGFYGDEDSHDCVECHSHCMTCDGPEDDDCVSCCEEYHFLHDGLCVLNCPEMFFEDNEQRVCLRCHPDCELCDGSCTSCREGQRLDGHGRCGPLANKCSSHHYADQDGQCYPCHKYCHQCSGPGKTHCLSCTQKHLLLSEWRRQSLLEMSLCILPREHKHLRMCDCLYGCIIVCVCWYRRHLCG
uniref:Growth factor receptor domain-containing protein n=1 Tax=Myripristis murdjan TaxID=586833 RepID=A0A667ZBY3_9TELE